MYKKIKKVLVCLMAFVLTFQTMNLDVLALDSNTSVELNPGEVTQSKNAKWVDYSKGIAEISFDVTGKNAEEPLDVAIVYDNSGSMQNSSGAPQANGNTYLTSRWNYASLAAKQLSANLLKNASNNIAFIPFSDVLIDGNSLHKKEILPSGDETTTDFFENHKLIYDEFGYPNIPAMRHVLNMYGPVEKAKTEEEKNIALAEFYEICNRYFGLTEDDLAEANNTQNALVPFTNNLATITNAIDSLYPANAGQTNYEVALNKAKEYLGSSNNRKVILMISDGKPNYGNNNTALAIAEELKASGVTIYTVGTGISEADATMLKQIASKDSGKTLYTSADPSELNTVLESLRKQFEVAASDAVIEDVINTDYFDYFTDETHFPTVNDVAIGSENFIVSDDKSTITWKIGDIRETTKTLRFYVKVKDTLLNDDLLSNDESLLNKEGAYATNKKANLSYKEINTGNTVNSGHEMTTPSLDVSTADMKVIYYLSDASGNIIEENGQYVVLEQKLTENKALHIPYEISPKNKIDIDGETYFIYKEDNKTITKTFTEEDANKTNEVSFRFVKQLNVTFDTNGYGTVENGEKTTVLPVDHSTMTIPSLPEIKGIPNDKIFAGWTIDKEGKGEYFTTSTEVKDNITVYAQWITKKQFTVTFVDDKGKTIKVDTVNEGDDAIAPTNPKKEGYTFTGWDKGFANVTENLIVTAQFEANIYTVKFDGNGANDGLVNDQQFTYDETKALNNNNFTKVHHTFDGWLYNGKKYKNEEEVKNLTSQKNGVVTLVAQWKEDAKYKVTFTDGFGNQLSYQEVYQGEDATAPENPVREGYSFEGWNGKYTNVQRDTVVVAMFRAYKYVVEFDGNGETAGTMENQNFTYGRPQALSKNTFTKENHTFLGWEYNNKQYNDEQEVKNLIATDGGVVRLVAKWKENDKFNVTFTDGFGTELKEETVYVGKDATAPANPEKEGYTFKNWDKDFTNVTENLTVNAVFEANTYTVKFDGNGQDSGTMANQEFVYDQAQNLTKNAFVKENYTFTGWTYKGVTYTDQEEVMNLIATNGGEVTLVAQWKENDKFNVTFTDGFGTELKEETVYVGKDATAPANPTKEGYTFKNWDKDFTNVTENLTVNAVFEANTYTVKFDGNGQDSGTMADQGFVYDQEQKLTKNAFVKENYTFTGWTYKGTTYTDEEEVMNLIATNGGEVTLVAQWKENDKFNVTFTDGFGTELKEETVYVGKDATAPANPTKEGYTFKNWDKDFTNVTENLTVNAVFEANTYTVKFDGNGQDSGTIADQGFVYDQEQKLTKNAFVRENYTFTGWTYRGTTYTDEEEVMNLIATDGGEVTLVAQWTENTKYTVTFVNGLGTVLDTQSVYVGKDATAPTDPERVGYTFLGWDLEFTNVTKDLTITALWEAEDTDTPVTPDTPNQPGVPTTPVPPIVPIVRTDPVVTPPAPVQPVQPVQPNPAPQEPEIVVPDNDTPEVKVDDNDTPKAKSSASWALINLICSILTVLLVIVIVLGKRKKEEEDEDEDETIAYKRRKWTMIAGAVVALGSVITFILTENIFLPMILVDKWTLLMAAILLVQVVVLVLAKKWKKEDDEEEATAQA
ncbi:InlB B-repeat-containing protein [Amedibacillus sp. YH-ame10]